MANILQKMFLSKQENQLIDIINKSAIEAVYKNDVEHLAMTTTYIINQKDAKISATHQWHFSQGDNYQLMVNDTLKDDVNSQKIAKKIFVRMRTQYIKQSKSNEK